MAKKFQLMITLAALAVFGAIFVPSAFAECGPGFHNKKELIEIVKKNPSIANGLRKELLAHPEYEYSADETVLNYLRESSQKVEKAPPGYKLSRNTWCPAGFGHYEPYGGLLENMPGKVMLWHVNKAGKAFPIMKGYCMNAVGGPPVLKKSPPKHKSRKPKPCGCKHKKHHKPPKKVVTCQARGLLNGPNGSCVNQTATTTTNPKQECEASDHSTTGCIQTTTVTVVQVNCGNYSSGNSGYLEQKENCTQKTEETCTNSSCNVTPPPKEECGCKSGPSISITSFTELNMIPVGKASENFEIGVYASEAGGVLTVDPGIGGVSLCGGSKPEGSVVFNSLPAGASKECVKFYAPQDADGPTKMKVKVTANLGTAHAEKEDEFKIENSAIRPS